MKLVALMTVVPLPEAETDKGSCAAFNHKALLIPFARISESGQALLLLYYYYYFTYFTAQTTAMLVLLSLLSCCCWATPATCTRGIAPAVLPARR